MTDSPDLRFANDLEAALSAADDAMRPLLDSVNIDDLARHNTGYSNYADARFDRFVLDERTRFARAAEVVVRTTPPGSRIVDLGCFIPHLPVALARLGYDVTIVERFELYGPSFGVELERLANQEGLKVVDLDLSSDSLAPVGRSDVVMLMAVLEHLNGSPASLMQRVREILQPNGILLIDVPNIAELGKRVGLMRGQSPLPPYGQYLESGYPFSGHNREMTVSEVRQLFETSGYVVEHLDVYDYVRTERLSGRQRLLRLAKRFLPMAFRDVILATGRLNSHQV